MKVKVNGITLNVVLEGDEKAPPVLLLHGFPDSSKLWAGQVPTLLLATSITNFSSFWNLSYAMYHAQAAEPPLAMTGMPKVYHDLHGNFGINEQQSSLKSGHMQIKPLIGAGYRVIVPDLRGFGESDAPKETSAYRMQNGVDDMVTLLDELKVDK